MNTALPGMVGRSSKTVRLSSGTVIWYHSGMLPISIRWIVVAGPSEQLEPQASFFTGIASKMNKLSNDSCCTGNSRSPLGKRERIWKSRRGDSGRRRQYCTLLRLYLNTPWLRRTNQFPTTIAIQLADFALALLLKFVKAHTSATRWYTRGHDA